MGMLSVKVFAKKSWRRRGERRATKAMTSS
jgi:hypothetical protein